jgi:hypothetical protein
MRRVIFLAACAAVFCATSIGFPASASAAGHEQVVFSGEASGAGGEVEFWVWCAVDQAGQYDDCNGALRFDDLHLVRHVDGEVSELADGTYQMDVSSTLDDSVHCLLTNTPPITSGRTNMVTVDCSSPSLHATGDDVVVTNGG